MGSVLGSKEKDKKLSEGIAAGFGDKTDEQKKQQDDSEPSLAAQMLTNAGQGAAGMASDAADYLFGKKKK